MYYYSSSFGPLRLSCQCEQDHAHGSDDSDNFRHIHVDHVVHDGRCHRDDTLEEDRTDNDVHDRCLVDRSSADQDRGDRGQRHVERRHVQLDETEALFIDQNSDSRQPCGHDDRQHTDLVYVDARRLCKGRVGTDCRHSCTCLGVQERPDAKCEQGKKQKCAGRDRDRSDVDLQEIGKRADIISLQLLCCSIYLRGLIIIN